MKKINQLLKNLNLTLENKTSNLTQKKYLTSLKEETGKQKKVNMQKLGKR